MSPVLDQFSICLELKLIACLPHSSWTNRILAANDFGAVQVSILIMTFMIVGLTRICFR